MKQLLISILFLVIIGFQAKAQEAASPKIVFEETVFDFDTIVQNSDGTHVFHFSNQGSVPLVISSAFSSCGCVVPEWPKQPISPNGQGEIKVKYNTSKTGHFTKVIVVKSNDPESPKTILRINGVVIEPPKEKQK
ncbi:MAG: DUF1573 domain-containing protein [Prevotellaceae bacterium]|nr:DUF1573 domain-containing protein [Prevotellaceae bacterium]